MRLGRGALVGGTVVAKEGSITTHEGWWNEPTRFFAGPRLAPVFPPTAASTIESVVVGTANQRTPRANTEAANPARSLVMPPPIATTTLERSSLQAGKA